MEKKPTSYDVPSQVFEITDYTTASDWERFISNLEDILIQWNLNNQSKRSSSKKDHDRPLKQAAISRGRWFERSDTIKFGEYPFDLRYRWLDESQDDLYEVDDDRVVSTTKLQIHPDGGDDDDDDESSDHEFQDCEDDTNDAQDSELPDNEKHYGDQELPDNLPTILLDNIDTKNDFSSRAHCLVRWYNLRRFITITPKDDYILATEDRIKLLLGSASIALANSECFVPIFIQIRHSRSNFFQGISEHNNIRTMYEMVYFRQSSQKYQYLSELINMFRDKLDCTLNDHISATIRLNYCLEDFTVNTLSTDRFHEQQPTNSEINNSSFSRTWQNELSNLVTKVKTATESLSSLARERKFYAQFQAALKELTNSQNKQDILRYIHVGALWPQMSDKVISDTQVHSDLNPAEAPIWTMRVVCKETYPNSIASILKELLDFSIQQADTSIIDVIRAIILVSCSVINEKFKNFFTELKDNDDLVSSQHEYLEPENLLEKLEKREFNVIYSILLRSEKQLYEIQAITDLFSKVINYIYEEIGGGQELDGSAAELRNKCQLLSYKLSSQPETILSRDPADDIRKLVVILFELQKHNRERTIPDTSISETNSLPNENLNMQKNSDKSGDHLICRSYRNFYLDHRPSVKEFILRTNVSRPFASGITPALPQRMFCTVSDDEFRLCGAFSELCD